jgi:hypothetical protein
MEYLRAQPNELSLTYYTARHDMQYSNKGQRNLNIVDYQQSSTVVLPTTIRCIYYNLVHNIPSH